MNLIYRPESISRTTTRAEWRKMDRARRIVQGVYRQMMANNRALLEQVAADATLFGASGVQIREDLTMRLIDPPVMI